MKNFYRSIRLIVICLVLCFLATACNDSKTESLNAFKNEVTSLVSRYDAYNSTLAGLDPSSETASVQLLSTIDKMASDAAALTRTRLPEEFADLSPEIQAYAENMQRSAEAFHQAFESEAFDMSAYTEARSALSDSNLHLQNIIASIRSVSFK